MNLTTGSGPSERGVAHCRACGLTELRPVVQLGLSPIANHLPRWDAKVSENKYPLNLMVCSNCSLGQIGEYESPDQIFSDYPYLSSTSKFWLQHAQDFASKMLLEVPQIRDGYVLEIASNDGYLLQNFLQQGVPVLGVDPAANVAPLAEKKGISTLVEFFGVETSKKILTEYGYPRLIVANNVAAHVPDMIDFFSGFANLSNEFTVITIENPTFGELLNQTLYDTIYHEHFSYLSVESISKLAKKVGLELFKVESLATHGGSFRYWLRKPNGQFQDDSVNIFLERERNLGVGSTDKEENFSNQVKINMSELREWIASKPPQSVIGYGAAAKTVTTFFAAALDESKFKFIVDASEFKQGRRLPGTSIPIYAPSRLAGESGHVLIFPWNLENEIAAVIKAINPEIPVWVPNPLRSIKS